MNEPKVLAADFEAQGKLLADKLAAFRALADEFGISRATVRRIEALAFKKLKAWHRRERERRELA
jgi:DNA-directed RNA polymerase sigma subunit (sigma70/sigma32)